MKFDGFENWPVMYTLFGFRLQIQLMLFLIQSDHLSEKFIIFFFIFLSLSVSLLHTADGIVHRLIFFLIKHIERF